MFVNKLHISPIYTGPGISKKVCSITMKNINAEHAAEFIKERLYLRDNKIPISIKPKNSNCVKSKNINRGLYF